MALIWTSISLLKMNKQSDQVPEARIEVNSEGGFYDGADKEIGKLDLKADAAGICTSRVSGEVTRFQ